MSGARGILSRLALRRASTILALSLGAIPAAGQTPSAVSAAVASRHLVKKVAPVYPPLAKMATIQGTVVLDASIGRDGRVTGAKFVSGPQLLARAAIDAVKQWRYRPFLVGGRRVEVRTRVSVAFSLGIPQAKSKREIESSQAYYHRSDQCHSLLVAREYVKAAQPCAGLPGLAAKLPPERRLERETAYRYAGLSLLYQRKYSEALPLFRHELAIAKTFLGPNNVELGYAYSDLAVTYNAEGDLKNAGPCYQQAISIIKRARQEIHMEFLKNEYAKYLVTLLRKYALFLQESGRMQASLKASREADALAQKVHP